MCDNRQPLKVCLDARVISGESGGIEQVIIGLAYGLSRLTERGEEFLFLTCPGADAWVRPHIGGPCRTLPSSARPLTLQRGRAGKCFVSLVRMARKMAIVLCGRAGVRIPRSDGTIERAHIDVMHFTRQSAFLTGTTSIYHPWDLQHLHVPQFFSRRECLLRETLYRRFCDQAGLVVAANRWTRQDIIERYELPEEKVRVVRCAPVLAVYPSPSESDLARAKEELALPPAYVFYPARTWKHKNHMGLLEALAILRDRHQSEVVAVFSGGRTEFATQIERRARELRVIDQVRFLGLVSPFQLHCLYKLCRCVVFPTMFEGLGMPLIEAFWAGAPIACSNVASLAEEAGSAALLFNPLRPVEIAEAILRLWRDEGLRSAMAGRGRERVSGLSWNLTARAFRAHYRQMSGRTLTLEDRALLAQAASA